MEALSLHLTYIEKIVETSPEKWSNMGKIEFLIDLRRFTSNIIIHIFLSTKGESIRVSLEKEYTSLNLGVRAMQINLPGFAYHKALKVNFKYYLILFT